MANTPFSPGLLPADNPLSQWAAPRRNALLGFGSGMLSSNWGDIGKGTMEGMALDRDYAMEAEKKADALQTTNQTAAFLRSKGANDLAAAVEGGMTSGVDAFNQWHKMANPGPGESFTLGSGDIRYDASGNMIAQGPAGGDPTTAMQEYDYARGQGYTGDFTTWKTDIARAGGTNIDMNNSQALAGGYADRMSAADSILADPKLTQAQTDAGQGVLSGVPMIGNFLTSDERQMAEQAQRDFVNAILRRESGAAIAPTEFDSAAKQYFPQPGDSPAVIQQKASNRKNAIQGVSRAAGASYAAPALGGGAGWQVLGVE